MRLVFGYSHVDIHERCTLKLLIPRYLRQIPVHMPDGARKVSTYQLFAGTFACDSGLDNIRAFLPHNPLGDIILTLVSGQMR